MFQNPHTRHFSQKFLFKFYRSSPKTLTEIYIRSAEEEKKNTPAFPQHWATFDTNNILNIISHVLTRLSDEIINLQPKDQSLRLLNKASR